MALSREVRVGAFAFTGLLVLGLVIFLIGDARRLFSSTDVYFAAFQEIEGLKAGSPVQMGGLEVGRVHRVDYHSDPSNNEIRVTLKIVREEARRIRADSVARVSPKGMLGDKLITITVGGPDQAPLPPGATIPSGPSNDMFAQVRGLGEKANHVLDNLERTSGTFAEESFREDLRQSASSVRNILQSVDQGDGYVPRLLNDKAEAEKLSRAISNLETTSDKLNQLLGSLNAAASRVNSGPGLAHEVIYGEEGAKVATQIGRAADELALTLEGIRNGDGLAHNLLYGGEMGTDGEKIASNVAAITDDLRIITRQLREGKGTLGALLVDPSVYEDVKVLLGNVQRNEVLRALVRYSIQQDEQQRKVEVRDPEAPVSSNPMGSPASAASPKAGSASK
ncbi:MAG: hypothetical protein RJA70_2554 [Pseudomonadota bacterium]|jgi:phospholipid/cholesterol/gamma-HCH transport system substrate-binding protein